MTAAQRRALRDLFRLERAAPDLFEIVGEPKTSRGWLTATVSIRVGNLEKRPGGLNLRERETFILLIGPSYPFAIPTLMVSHSRFAGFPHVTWSKYICLYQGILDWNPTDGLFGFFARLNLWLVRAALNDMDPVEGPLEPPHHVVDYSEKPFVIRANAPVPAGTGWLGLAKLISHQSRVELVGWQTAGTDLSPEAEFALAVILPSPLPMEFPEQGSAFFAELAKQDVDRGEIIVNLALAALLTKKAIQFILYLDSQ